MSKVYNTQTDLKIVVKTGKDLTTASEVKLKYKDPRGAQGELIVTTPAPASGVMEFVTQAGEPFSIVGNWRFWAYIVDNGLVSIGDPFVISFNQEGG